MGTRIRQVGGFFLGGVSIFSGTQAFAAEFQLSSSPVVTGTEVTLRAEGGVEGAIYALFVDTEKGDYYLPGGVWLGLGMSPHFSLMDNGQFGRDGIFETKTFLPEDDALIGAVFFVQGLMLELSSFRFSTTNRLDIVVRGPSTGILCSAEEIARLPTSGSAWQRVKSEADKATGTPDLSNQDDDVNVRVLAKALVFARTGDEKYRSDVIKACMDAMWTEKGGRTLALARELGAYVVAADMVGLPPAEDAKFRDWIRACLTEVLDGKTLISTHEDRPNNWGTHAGGARAAVAAYLGDEKELARCAQVFKGWLGDRSSYAGFAYGDLSWQADPKNPVGINPKGSTRDGHSIDGVLPDDQRRAGGFKWPPPKENYVYEGLQGVLLQAIILDRSGYDVWNWQDKAILRAFTWLEEQANFNADGDDTWQPHVVNHFYAENFPAPEVSSPGKNIGWTCWLYGTADQ